MLTHFGILLQTRTRTTYYLGFYDYQTKTHLVIFEVKFHDCVNCKVCFTNRRVVLSNICNFQSWDKSQRYLFWLLKLQLNTYVQYSLFTEPLMDLNLYWNVRLFWLANWLHGRSWDTVRSTSASRTALFQRPTFTTIPRQFGDWMKRIWTKSCNGRILVTPESRTPVRQPSRSAAAVAGTTVCRTVLVAATNAF